MKLKTRQSETTAKKRLEQHPFWDRDPFELQMGCLTALLWLGGLYYGAGSLLLAFCRGANPFSSAIYFLAPFIWPLAVCLFPCVQSFSVAVGVIACLLVFLAWWLFFGAKTIKAFLISIFIFLFVFATSMLALVRYGHQLWRTGL